MDTKRACELLAQRRIELNALTPDTLTETFQEWMPKTLQTLLHALGEDHALYEDFHMIQWTPTSSGDSHLQAFVRGQLKADGLLKTAIYELEVLAYDAEVAEVGALDPQLLEHVRHLIEQERWGQVASQACIFTEDKIRQWAGRPDAEIGDKLMTAVFGNDGDFRLGKTSGEQQGWHRLAMGFAMALRNVDTHRIQQRADHERYALGVVGTASLLLTQLRYEHGNRFKSG